MKQQLAERVLLTPIALLLVLILRVRAQGKTQGYKCNNGMTPGPFCVRLEEDVCVDNPRELCKQVTRQDCKTIEQTNCVPVTEELCDIVPSTEENCTEIEQEICEQVPKQICHPIKETRCEQVPKVTCPEYMKCKCDMHHHLRGRKFKLCRSHCAVELGDKKCRPETQKECVAVHKLDCFTNSSTECHTVHKWNCVSGTETLCHTKSTQNCETVPEESCQDLQEEICETVTDQVCTKEVVERFCGDSQADELRSIVLNGEVQSASRLLSTSDKLFSLSAGLMYLTEQEFMITRSENRTLDPDVIAFQALANAALNGTDVTKLVNAVLLSIGPNCPGSTHPAEEFDEIARGLIEDFQDQSYLEQLIDSDLSEFDGFESGRRLEATDTSPTESFICAYCKPSRSCVPFSWC